MNHFQRHFYQLDYEQRLQLIQHQGHLSQQQLQIIHSQMNLANQNLIENYLTDYSLPEGVAVNFKINDQSKMVPMVTEEPSVIAAASNGAKIMKAQGIQTQVLSRQLMGQIILRAVSSTELNWLNKHLDQLLKIANQAHPSLLKHGGGARTIKTRKLASATYSLDLFVDVGEAMGANLMNTMLEAIGTTINLHFSGSVLMQILSNYATHCLAQATTKIALDQLTTKQMDGKLVAQRIAEASQIAQLDPYRATTHNKGILNGVDAVVLAMGNDWRAIESGIHAFAARNGQYQGLSTWKVVDHQLVGKLILPLPVGFVGGATKLLPLVKINHQIANLHSARELMQLIVAVGLAQNLAALRAIVTDGIQRGHMYLQLKSLARSSGATIAELPVVLQRLRAMKHPDQHDVKTILVDLRKKG